MNRAIRPAGERCRATPRDASTRPRPHRCGRALSDLVALLLGTSIAGLGLVSVSHTPDQNLEEFALGREARTHFATVDGVPIHCSEIGEAQACLDGHARRAGRDVILWLGNSQLHAINQKRPGDRTAPEILHHTLDARRLDGIAFSMPNANYQEMLVAFVWLSERLPVRRLIVPLVFDDFRETGLRADVASAIGEPDVVAALQRYAAGRRLLPENDAQPSGSLDALAGTAQERTELFLNEWLGRHWALWEQRKKARGTLFLELHILRNTTFGITPQSKRRAIPGNLRLNMEALEALLDEAARRGIVTITYVAPLRDDIPTPYVPAEYEAFKRHVETVVRGHDAAFANLETLVPAGSWGLKNATTLGAEVELDFMHFQGSGHELLAEAVRRLLDGTSG